MTTEPEKDTASADNPVPESTDAGDLNPDVIRDRVIQVLKTCYDPEIPVNIYELGLIYGVHVADDGAVNVKMTLTSPMCPVAGSLPPEVEAKVNAVDGVKSAQVDVVWDPPWDMSKMSEAARVQLNLM